MGQDQTSTAKTVAREASVMLKRTVSPKQVRGLARGDNGPAVIARFADDAYTAHVYTAAERRALLEAFAKREARRTGGKAPSVPAAQTDRKARAAARAAKGTPDARPARGGRPSALEATPEA